MLFFGKLPRGKGRGEVYLNGRGCDRLFEQCFCDQKVWMTYVHTPCLPCIHNSSVLSTERRDETECRWQSNDEISNILLKRRQTRFKRTELASQVGSFVSRISPEIEQPPLRRGADRVQGISVSFPLRRCTRKYVVANKRLVEPRRNAEVSPNNRFLFTVASCFEPKRHHRQFADNPR